MDLKKKSNILAEEEPKYIISLKEGYRILHIIMSILFLSCTLYFGMISFRAGTDTMVFDIGFTGIVFYIHISIYVCHYATFSNNSNTRSSTSL